jgi:hypothetical protein
MNKTPKYTIINGTKEPQRKTISATVTEKTTVVDKKMTTRQIEATKRNE